eukprot:COSAG02_NODE_6520_length_3522_cov_4.230724_6_plen_163_part_00
MVGPTPSSTSNCDPALVSAGVTLLICANPILTLLRPRCHRTHHHHLRQCLPRTTRPPACWPHHSFVQRCVPCTPRASGALYAPLLAVAVRTAPTSGRSAMQAPRTTQATGSSTWAHRSQILRESHHKPCLPACCLPAAPACLPAGLPVRPHSACGRCDSCSC